MDTEGFNICICGGKGPHKVDVWIDYQRSVDVKVRKDIDRIPYLAEVCPRPVCAGDGTTGDVSH